MKIAVAGCVHGSLNRLYQTFDHLQQREGGHIQLLLVCGDFQSVRNRVDLQCMAVPEKYRELGDFHEYYSGKRVAPVLTLFIGGNHEASNYLMGLPYGGWVAPNIFFMGYSSVVNFNGLRIAGLTGIYSHRGLEFSHGERLPLNQGSMRHVYHSRMIDTWRMLQLRTSPDVVMTHDWPKGVEHYGDLDLLLRLKPWFRQDIQTGKLGNMLHGQVLAKLRPPHWFAAHMHVRFTATIHFEDGQPAGRDDHSAPQVTQFLALDKCLPKRSYLEVVHIPTLADQVSTGLQYDPEWLAVLKTSIEWRLDQGSFPTFNPDAEDLGLDQLSITQEQLDKRIGEVRECFGDDFSIPSNFVPVQPVLLNQADCDPNRRVTFENPQTTQFCWRLGVRVPEELLPDQPTETMRTDKLLCRDESELSLKSDAEEEEGEKGPPTSGFLKLLD